MYTITMQPAVQKTEPIRLKPLGLLGSIFLFGIPAVALAFSRQWVIPYIAPRSKNTGPGMISHFLLNGAGILPSSL